MDEFLIEMQLSFLSEAEDLIYQSEKLFLLLEKKRATEEDLKSLKRIFHNLKGSGKAVGLDNISRFCHEIENLIVLCGVSAHDQDSSQLLILCNDQLLNEVRGLKTKSIKESDFELYIELLVAEVNRRKNFQTTTEVVNCNIQHNQLELPIMKEAEVRHKDENIKVSLKKIDEILDIFGEQIIFLSALDHYRIDPSANKDVMEKTIFNLKKLSYELQQQTLALRMVGLKNLNDRLERVIRDASMQTGKKVTFNFYGIEQELDKTIVDQISDPLMHMLRNSMDHGIESGEERISLGKPEMGTIDIFAKREGGSFLIQIVDDGRGLDKNKILKKAIERKLVNETDHLSEYEIFELLFLNGFSTKDVANEMSGRGVGMNVVKEMILAMKGSYEIESKLGVGTRFKIKLPLSLSLFNGVVVESNEERYVIPSSQINEIVDSKVVSSLEISEDKEALQLNSEVIEMKILSQMLYQKKYSTIKKTAVYIITTVANKRIALRVDKLLSIQKIAQKPLSSEMRITPGASGLTILGDGKPVIILDLNRLLKGKT